MLQVVVVAWVAVENEDHQVEDAEYAIHAESHDALSNYGVIQDIDVWEQEDDSMQV